MGGCRGWIMQVAGTLVMIRQMWKTTHSCGSHPVQYFLLLNCYNSVPDACYRPIGRVSYDVTVFAHFEVAGTHD